jgi:hypothetical protein
MGGVSVRSSEDWSAMRGGETVGAKQTVTDIFSISIDSQNIIWYIYVLLQERPEFTSELYQPSKSRLSAKLVPTFVDRGLLQKSNIKVYFGDNEKK